MKFFPLKIAIICLVLTPFLYILTLTFFQQYLDQYYLQTLQNKIVGDYTPLLNGTVHIKEQVADNIHAFLKKNALVQYTGLEMAIQVTTRPGKIIYPLHRNRDYLSTEIHKEMDSDTIVNENFEILQNELEVKTQVNLNHGSPLANLLLFVLSALSLSIFFVFYRIANRKAVLNRQSEKKLIKDLRKKDNSQQQILQGIKKERQGLFEKIDILNTKYQSDKERAKINEEEMFEEILSLEKQLNTFIDLKKRRENEIDQLKSTIQQYERRNGSKTRRNEFDFLSKLFSVLYKNIVFNRKALTGFLNLTEDQQIKAEEIIHQLDQNPENIIIKRKVFSGKKHKSTCLEAFFAYNGRLYFRKKENILEVVVIGTKNTQTKDMEFLHSL